tara:strand:+ start:7098 stop:7928 length:831 start_codon:yes stop_codon:yes gene_type:complete
MSNEAEGSILETGNPEATATDWTADLDDYKDVIEAKGWKGANDVLKSYVNLEKQVGADKVVLPTEGSNLSEWEGWSKLGTPEKAEDYELSAPEGFEAYSQELSDWFRGAAHEMKLPAEMAQGFHDRYVEYMMAQAEGAQTQRIDQQNEWEGELQKEYGNAFSQRVEAAKRAIREYGSPELEKLLAETGLGSNPHVVRAFVKAGMALGSGPVFKDGETSGQFGTTPDMAKEQVAALRGHPGYFDPTHPEHGAIKKKVQRLSELAYGNEDATANVSVG